MKFGEVAHEGSPETNSNPGVGSGRRRGLPKSRNWNLREFGSLGRFFITISIFGGAREAPCGRMARCHSQLSCAVCRVWRNSCTKSECLHSQSTWSCTGRRVLDLTPYIREEILLNLPVHPHCDRGRPSPLQGESG